MGSPLPLVCQMESPIWSMLFAAVSMMVRASSKVFSKILLVIESPPFSMDSKIEYIVEMGEDTIRTKAKEDGFNRPLLYQISALFINLNT